MILLTSYYQSDSYERDDELLMCLQKNIDNDNIKKIKVFNEAYFDPVLHEKIEYIHWDRPTYQDFFDLIEEGEINLISNSDIYFDDSVVICNKMKDNQCLAITRHELRDGLIKRFYGSGAAPAWSQDVWVFKKKPKRNVYDKVIAHHTKNGGFGMIPFNLGVAGCDNHLAYLLQQEFRLVNPYPDIRVIHVHDDETRDVTWRITGQERTGFGMLKKVTPTRI